MKRRSLVAPILLPFLAATANAQVTLDGPHAFPVGRQPSAAASGDFDEDGRMDLVVTNYADNSLNVLRNLGAGSFETLPPIATGNLPRDVAVADFNRDGHADFVTADLFASGLTLRFGDGTGGFPTGITPASGNGPSVIRLADFDLDGDTDILVTLYSDAAVMLNDGTGGFPEAMRVGLTPLGDMISADAADFDEDGIPDVVAMSLNVPNPFSRNPLDVFVRKGNGAGAFSALASFKVDPTLKYALDVQAKDLDADGHADLLIAGFVDGSYALYGDGTGAFSPAQRIDTGGFTERFAVVDIDENGTNDLVASNTEISKNVGVILGAGSRGFFSPLVFESSEAPRRLAAADFDGDRHVDVVVPIDAVDDSVPSTVEFFFNRTPGLCRAGTVNTGLGAVTDVLFVNDSAGGPARTISLTSFEPLLVFLALPPAATSPKDYAMYAWPGGFVVGEEHQLPFGIGPMCRPSPLTGGSPQPIAIWNSTSKTSLGVPTMPSPRAPVTLMNRPSGLRRAASFCLQGIIVDPGSSASKPASVTNGIAVIVR